MPPLSRSLELLLPCKEISRICEAVGYRYRDSLYTPMMTVWLFILQVLSADHSCQSAIAKYNAYRANHKLPTVSSDTSGYCKARSRLPEVLMERLLDWTAQQCDAVVQRQWLFKGREVDIIDGTTLTMADTPENQRAYPQAAGQNRGCGFPIARMVAVFSLATGAISMMALGTYRGKEQGETGLLRTLLDRFSLGKILLADRYYASFWNLALSELRGIDLVARVHHLRKVDFRRGLRQGYYDQIVSYGRPPRPQWMSKQEYRRQPESILVRHIRYQITQPGFRTRVITLATTLLDAELYQAEELAELYRQRWMVELHIRSLKTQMQMEHLRCHSPSMVRKEIHCHLIAYNIVRAAIVQAASVFGYLPAQLSFTAAMQAVEEYAAARRLGAGPVQPQCENLLQSIASVLVGNRPGRHEPRELKRRQKNYKLLKIPRRLHPSHYSLAT